MLALRSRLREAGVLGLNRRNADYIAGYNPRRLYPLVDDKLRTKQLAVAAGIAVPELYCVIEAQHEIGHLDELLGGRTEFALKPSQGSGGNGIMVIAGRRGRRYRKAGGSYVDAEELEHHVSNALSGLYSLGGHRDKVMFEYRVKFDPVFADVSFEGVPDVRILVFKGYPTMAMVRLPTRTSQGRANLHQGAVGVGIDIVTGRTLGGVLGNEVIHEHPDTDQPITGLLIPSWDTMLDLAARCYELTGLGYLGVDIVLDRDLGPLILELNARPGLQIQVANATGLMGRLELLEREAPPEASPTERVAYAKERFAAPVSRLST